MAWLYLALAAVFEVAFAFSMKASKGFTVFWPSVGTVIGVVGGIGLLTIALRSIPVSVGYPIWVGLGALGSVAFGEALNPLKLVSVLLIAAGVAGLKVSSA